MSAAQQKLTVVEKVGYSFGDTAANFVFQALMIFQLSYYADTLGIGAQAAGTMFLIVRICDAFFDPIVGVMADRTHSRWGKFRPWILWTAIPFGLIAFLSFASPGFGLTGKIIYAYVTYILLNLIYSMNNCPYSALSGVMTNDLDERTSLSSYRFVFAMIGAFAIQAIGPKLLVFFGDTGTGVVDYTRGYRITMGIFAALSVVFFFITFATTKERIAPLPDQKSSIRHDLMDLFHNGPWIALSVLTIFMFIGLVIRGNVMMIYFKYYLNSDESAFGFFNAMGLAATIVGILFSKPLATRYGKRNVFIGGLGLTMILTAAFVMVPASNIKLVFATEMVRQFFYGFTIPLLWAMMADVADYSEWKTNRRATGIVFSAVVFGLKAGLGFGGFIAGWVLSLYGYQSNTAQTAEAIDGIRITISIYPAIAFLIGVIALCFYRIDKNLNIQISRELMERHAAAVRGDGDQTNPTSVLHASTASAS